MKIFQTSVCLICLFVIYWRHSVDSLSPHHVVKRLNATVVADYWTTNRFEVVPDYYDGISVHFKTNKLW